MWFASPETAQSCQKKQFAPAFGESVTLRSHLAQRKVELVEGLGVGGWAKRRRSLLGRRQPHKGAKSKWSKNKDKALAHISEEDKLLQQVSYDIL